MSDRTARDGQVPNPLLHWKARGLSTLTPPLAVLPEVLIVVGTDDRSSGFTITSYRQQGDRTPMWDVLYAVRWREKPQSIQEALEIASRGITSALAELFDVHLD